MQLNNNYCRGISLTALSSFEVIVWFALTNSLAAQCVDIIAVSSFCTRGVYTPLLSWKFD
jgi:hypothetical protein